MPGVCAFLVSAIKRRHYQEEVGSTDLVEMSFSVAQITLENNHKYQDKAHIHSEDPSFFPGFI